MEVGKGDWLVAIKSVAAPVSGSAIMEGALYCVERTVEALWFDVCTCGGKVGVWPVGLQYELGDGSFCVQCELRPLEGDQKIAIQAKQMEPA